METRRRLCQLIASLSLIIMIFLISIASFWLSEL